jgi:hypothetical protein
LTKWRNFIGDSFWVNVFDEDDGDVGVEFKDGDEEVSTFWLNPKMAYTIGKQLMDLGRAP